MKVRLEDKNEIGCTFYIVFLDINFALREVDRYITGDTSNLR
jgi:hypothetical protein